ncbi:MAG: NlpC/P60 family protein [Clostridiales bacterium]|nr:NlpC/P60 family protein [Clostridiales bacterium]
MQKLLKRLGISFLIAVFLLNAVILPATDVSTVQAEASTSTMTATVNSSILHIRTRKSTSATCIATLKKGKKVTLLTTGKTWVKVRVNGKTGYTKGKYLSTTYGTASNLYANAEKGTVTSSVLRVFSKKSTNGTVLARLKKGASIKVLTTDTKWVKVVVDGVVGYAKGKNIKMENGGTASNTTTKGEAVVKYALQFVGNPYVWGGTSLTNGADCSGFIMSVYKHFGVSLPHSSSAMRSCGTKVSSLSAAKPGDIICYNGHVALYMGNNKIVHASSPSTGIKISTNAAYRSIVTIRRIL